MTKENWKAVPGYEGWYEVSDLGGVRSLDREIQHKGSTTHLKGKTLSPFKTGNGYARICLNKHGKRKFHFVHRLVYITFVDKIPDKHETNHINGLKTDNRPTNLEMITRAEHVQRTHALGQFPKGDDHWLRKRKTKAWKKVHVTNNWLKRLKKTDPRALTEYLRKTLWKNSPGTDKVSPSEKRLRKIRSKLKYRRKERAKKLRESEDIAATLHRIKK